MQSCFKYGNRNIHRQRENPVIDLTLSDTENENDSVSSDSAMVSPNSSPGLSRAHIVTMAESMKSAKDEINDTDMEHLPSKKDICSAKSVSKIFLEDIDSEEDEALPVLSMAKDQADSKPLLDLETKETAIESVASVKYGVDDLEDGEILENGGKITEPLLTNPAKAKASYRHGKHKTRNKKRFKAAHNNELPYAYSPASTGQRQGQFLRMQSHLPPPSIFNHPNNNRNMPRISHSPALVPKTSLSNSNSFGTPNATNNGQSSAFSNASEKSQPNESIDLESLRAAALRTKKKVPTNLDNAKLMTAIAAEQKSANLAVPIKHVEDAISPGRDTMEMPSSVPIDYKVNEKLAPQLPNIVTKETLPSCTAENDSGSAPPQAAPQSIATQVPGEALLTRSEPSLVAETDADNASVHSTPVAPGISDLQCILKFSTVGDMTKDIESAEDDKHLRLLQTVNAEVDSTPFIIESAKERTASLLSEIRAISQGPTISIQQCQEALQKCETSRRLAIDHVERLESTIQAAKAALKTYL